MLPCRLSHRVTDFYRNQRIFHKIVSLNIMLLGAFCLIGIASTQITTRIYDDQLYLRTAQVMSQLSTGIENNLKDVESFSLDIALDPEIQDQLAKAKSNTYEQIEGVNKLRDKLLVASVSQKSHLSSISFIDPSGRTFDLGDNPAEVDNAGTAKLIRRAISANGGYVFDESNQPSAEFQSAREIIEYNNVSLRPLGTLLFRCNLDEIVRANYNKMSGDQVSLYIYSGNKPIYSEKGVPPISLVPHGKKAGHSICTINGERFFFCLYRFGLYWVDVRQPDPVPKYFQKEQYSAECHAAQLPASVWAVGLYFFPDCPEYHAAPRRSDIRHEAGEDGKFSEFQVTVVGL